MGKLESEQSTLTGGPYKEPPRGLGRRKGTVLVVSSLGGFLVTFMGSAINIALPLIGAEFKVSAVTLSWVSLAYVLVSGACLLPAGRLADLYGRVRIFTYGMVIFSVFALASAFAPSAPVLLVLRALNGIGLATGSATSTALVITAYPPHIRGRALGLNVACIYSGLTLGPVLGGFIVHQLGWRALFVITGVLGLINVWLPAKRLLNLDRRHEAAGRFDVIGAAVYAVGLTAVLVGLSFLPALFGAALTAAGAAGLGLFVWWEGRASDPLLDMTLFRRNRVFALSNAAALIQYSATAAVVFLLSLYLQYNRGLDPQKAGLVLVTGSVVQVLLAPLVGRLTDRLERRYLASAGMAAGVLGILGLSFAGETTPFWYIIVTLCVLNGGVAFFSTPNTHAVMNSVDTRLVGVASATLATMRQAGMNLSQGIATMVLALEVGRRAIEPADYPQLLESLRISYWIFTALSLVGVAACLVGPRRKPRETE